MFLLLAFSIVLMCAWPEATRSRSAASVGLIGIRGGGGNQLLTVVPHPHVAQACVTSVCPHGLVSLQEKGRQL